MLRAYFTNDAVDAMTLMDDPLFLTGYGGDASVCQHTLRILLGQKDLEIVWARIFDPLRTLGNGGLKYGVLCRDREKNAYYIEMHKSPHFASLSRACECAVGIRQYLGIVEPDIDPYITVFFVTTEDILGKGRLHCVVGERDREGNALDKGISIHYLWTGAVAEKEENNE